MTNFSEERDGKLKSNDQVLSNGDQLLDLGRTLVSYH